MTNLVVTGVNITFDALKNQAGLMYFKFPVVAGTKNPDFSKEPVQAPDFIHYLNVGTTANPNYKSYDAHITMYPIVEYTYDVNPAIDNKCLGANKEVNVTYAATDAYSSVAKNPVLNQMAFWSSLLGWNKKTGYYYSLASVNAKSGGLFKDTLDHSNATFAYKYTATSDVKNDTLVVTDFMLPYGLFKVASMVVNQSTFLLSSKVSAEALVSSAIKCNGGDAEVTVSATGGTAAYTGTGVKLAVKAGNASYDVTDANGCKGTATINVTEPTTLTVVASEVSKASNDNTKDGKAKVVATGGTSPYTYVWSANAGSTSEVTVGKGNYSVVVTDINGCVKDGSVVITAGTASISELAIEGLSIYPNPTSTNLTVAFSSKGSASIELVNVAGQVVDTKNTTGVSNTSFDMTSLETGVYFVNIKVAEGTAIFKVVKD